MEISSVGASQSRLMAQRVGLSGRLGNFTDLLASAGASEARTVSVPVRDARHGTTAKPDFQSMTPTEFKSQAQAMYDRGEIDLTTLGVMQLAGNTDESTSFFSGNAIDFTSRIKSLMEFEVASGHRTSDLSPYKIYENILSKIAPRTGVNLVG